MSQATDVFDYMVKHGSITQEEAKDKLGCARLASRICDLKNIQIPIYREMIPVQNRHGETCHVARYSFSNVVEALSIMAQLKQKAAG